MASVADPILPRRRVGSRRATSPSRGVNGGAPRTDRVGIATSLRLGQKAREQPRTVNVVVQSPCPRPVTPEAERLRKRKPRSRTAAPLVAEVSPTVRAARAPRASTPASLDAYRTTSRTLNHGTALRPTCPPTPPPAPQPREEQVGPALASAPPPPASAPVLPALPLAQLTPTPPVSAPAAPPTALPPTVAPITRNSVSPTVFTESRRATVTPPRSPVTSAPNGAEEFLIPAARPKFAGKLVVVLDLDETLVSSRESSVMIRPGTDILLQSLKGKCELIIWTAGTRDYALDVIRQIDPHFAVQHCIYRHPMWWTTESGCVKDLRLLGRPLDRVLLVDNTPDVFRANPANSILVSDFDGTNGATDRVLVSLADLFDESFQQCERPTARDVLRNHRIKERRIPLDNGQGHIQLNTLADDVKVVAQPFGSSNGGRLSMVRSYRYT